MSNRTVRRLWSRIDKTRVSIICSVAVLLVVGPIHYLSRLYCKHVSANGSFYDAGLMTAFSSTPQKHLKPISLVGIDDEKRQNDRVVTLQIPRSFFIDAPSLELTKAQRDRVSIKVGGFQRAFFSNVILKDANSIDYVVVMLYLEPINGTSVETTTGKMNFNVVLGVNTNGSGTGEPLSYNKNHTKEVARDVNGVVYSSTTESTIVPVPTDAISGLSKNVYLNSSSSERPKNDTEKRDSVIHQVKQKTNLTNDEPFDDTTTAVDMTDSNSSDTSPTDTSSETLTS